ncbi:MAG: citrate synthase [Lachnospiraceae bacterium]|nr:citrate synthase [Lachnospiraceae bacterium]
MLSLDEMGELKGDFSYLLGELDKNHRIDQNLYSEYDVKRGLRDANGKGVLTGLTEVSDVIAFDRVDGVQVPCDGRLYYQGINVIDLVKGLENRRYGFEEVTFLLLFGRLPKEEELDRLLRINMQLQDLGARFVRDVVMKASNGNIMNALQRCVLTLYTYDDNPDSVEAEDVLRQSLELINKIPLIAVYSYHSYLHFRKDEALVIRNPKKGLSLSENILQMLRPDGKFTQLEAKVLDIALIVHADHGGGNNSTFTTHVVSSTGTDTYSSVAASIGSLKGPKHGGANLKVQEMFDHLFENIKDIENETEIENYLTRILDGEVFDHAGLIYGMGHAVYTLSDPREVILKEYARKLAAEKGLSKEFSFYDRVEHIASRLIMNRRNVHKAVSANVDFYSGFVYGMLGIPRELFTPLFAIARISGWSAHRLEELMNNSKIIRPAYKYVGVHVPYVNVEDR